MATFSVKSKARLPENLFPPLIILVNGFPEGKGADKLPEKFKVTILAYALGMETQNIANSVTVTATYELKLLYIREFMVISGFILYYLCCL